MRLLRVFTVTTHFAEWYNAAPDLDKLLLCFGVRAGTAPVPASVFKVKNELEELESAAAVFQKSRSSPEKQFGVLVTEKECQQAGILIDEQDGDTGIEHVDTRHRDLVGDNNQFRNLMAGIVKQMWEGEQRLGVFPAKQVTGQVAVFSRLPDGRILNESRETCEAVLSKSDCHQFDTASLRVEIRGILRNKRPCDVWAWRSYAAATTRRHVSISLALREILSKQRWLNALLSQVFGK